MLLSTLGHFRRCCRANVASMTAVLAIPMMVAVGTAIDTGEMVRVRSDLQAALDASAMGIAISVPSGADDDALQTLGKAHFETLVDEKYLSDDGVFSYQYHGLTTDADGFQHMLVTVSYPYRLLVFDVFSRFSSREERRMVLSAEVSVRTGDPACVYALHRSAPRAIEVAGNASVTMDGCVLASNSAAKDGIYIGGSANLAADCLQSAGGIAASGGVSLDCASGRTNAWPLPDPFAHLQEPMPPIMLASPKKQDTTVVAGRYWDLSLDGTKKLEPGLYYLEGDLTIKGDVSGEGVTFYLKNGSVTVNGSASLDLSAPREGDHAGMLFVSHPTNRSSHQFNGNGATDLDGYLYFPGSHLQYSGNNETSSSCLRIVAETITMTGSSSMRSDCTAELGGREAKASGPLYFSR